jgi:tetratricopeptide (TPR) repeat protein
MRKHRRIHAAFQYAADASLQRTSRISLHIGILLALSSGTLSAQVSIYDASSPVWAEPPLAGTGDGPFPEFSAARESRDSAGTDPRTPLPSAPGTVSVDRLTHPLSSKALHMLQKADKASRDSAHDAAIRILKETLERYPSSAPYVHSMLGVEYAKMRQFQNAAQAMALAVAAFPLDPVNRANLAYALCYLGEYGRAEAEVHRALEPDSTSSSAREILSVIERRKEFLQHTHSESSE